nr:VOC family protein [Streptomyces dysideae]
MSSVFTRDWTRASAPGAGDLSLMLATLPPMREHAVTVTGYTPLQVTKEEVMALGAKPLDTEDRSRSFRVYADPAGHPFCLCAC